MQKSTTIRTIRRHFARGEEESIEDTLSIEEPLELRVEGEATAVLMRTPGRDLDLCRGFLFTEGVIEDQDDIIAIAHIDSPSRPKGNTVDVRLSSGVPLLRKEQAKRAFFSSSSCGICGKESIDRIMKQSPPLPPPPRVSSTVVYGLTEKMRSAQENFAQTGGIHAVALFDMEGTLLMLEEDVGRHNALDKLIGRAVREDRLPLHNTILLLSGRAGFELLQKAWMAQIPVVVAIGAPTSLAVEMAEKAGIVLYAFVRQDRFNQYTFGMTS